MKERVLDFNEIVKETLMSRIRLQEIPLPEDLKSFKSKRLLGFAESQNYLFKDNQKIEKLAYSYINLNRIAIITIGLVYPEDGFDIPILIFEKMELPRIITFAFIDFVPLSIEADYHKKYIEPLKFLNEDLDFIPGKKNSPSQNFKSPYSFSGFFKRYHKFSLGVALERYLELWIKFLEDAVLINSNGYNEEIKSCKKKFKEEYSFTNRSSKILSSIFGKNLTERLLKEVLF